MWPNLQFPTDLVKFTEEIFNEKLHVLCSESKGDVARGVFRNKSNIYNGAFLWK